MAENHLLESSYVLFPLGWGEGMTCTKDVSHRFLLSPFSVTEPLFCFMQSNGSGAGPSSSTFDDAPVTPTMTFVSPVTFVSS